VGFKGQKKHFALFKNNILVQFLPKCKPPSHVYFHFGKSYAELGVLEEQFCIFKTHYFSAIFSHSVHEPLGKCSNWLYKASHQLHGVDDECDCRAVEDRDVNPLIKLSCLVWPHFNLREEDQRLVEVNLKFALNWSKFETNFVLDNLP